ncbi:MAG TPA: hypothetical protein VLD63_05410 [Anaerolineales bacterium]|nr:hypothetical protein [Anaerolineales bacterium]
MTPGPGVAVVLAGTGELVGVFDGDGVAVSPGAAAVVTDAAGVRLGVPDGRGVGDGPDVRVREGVGLGPDVAEAVRVGVREGVRLAVAVEVLVLVDTGEEVVLGVEVGLEVSVAGGAVTVKDPELRERGTPPPEGLVAAALARPRVNVPGAALPSTLNEIVASVPSGMAVWLSPKTTMRTLEDEGCEQLNDLPAPWAPEPRLTARPLQDPEATTTRLLSKVTSKFAPATWAPS